MCKISHPAPIELTYLEAGQHELKTEGQNVLAGAGKQLEFITL